MFDVVLVMRTMFLSCCEVVCRVLLSKLLASENAGSRKGNFAAQTAGSTSKAPTKPSLTTADTSSFFFVITARDCGSLCAAETWPCAYRKKSRSSEKSKDPGSKCEPGAPGRGVSGAEAGVWLRCECSGQPAAGRLKPGPT